MIMPVSTEAAAQGAVIAGMIAMTVPANLLSEGAFLILVVCSIAIQAQHALKVGLAHLHSAHPQWPGHVGRLSIREDVSIREVLIRRFGVRGHGVSALDALAGCEHHAGVQRGFFGFRLGHGQHVHGEGRVGAHGGQRLGQQRPELPVCRLQVLSAGRRHDHRGTGSPGGHGAHSFVATRGLNHHHRLQGHITPPVEGQNPEPELVCQLAPEVRQSADVWPAQAVVRRMRMHWHMSARRPAPPAVLNSNLLLHILIGLQNVGILLATPRQVPAVSCTLIVRIHVLHAAADCPPQCICHMHHSAVKLFAATRPIRSICSNGQGVIAICGRSFHFCAVAQLYQLLPPVAIRSGKLPSQHLSL
mmetsp:Transcript_89484/g.213829  ORF Transcript_89484/g.213829 Transcript_89484/m.213829 type:complete len:360 (-) Transcript_89484:779-1858(-)